MKPSPLQELGKRLKMLREELGLKQKDFALQLGISGSLLSQIESGQKNPVYELLYKLQTHYRVSLDWLFTGKGEPRLKRKPVFSGGEDQMIDEIENIEGLVWCLEHSNLFNLNVMGYAVRFFYENEEHIKKEFEKTRAKKNKNKLTKRSQ